MRWINNGGLMSDRRMAGLVIALGALLVLTGSITSSAAEKVAPDFTLKNLDGEEVTLSEALEGGPVVIDFWATWCKPCIRAFPELQQVLDKYENCGLRLFAVSIDGPKSTSRVGSLIKSKGNTFEVLLDPSQKVARKFHVSSVPRTVLVNTDGEIVYAVTGYRPTNHEALDKAISKLLPEECPEGEGEGGEGEGDDEGEDEETAGE
jgi:peroxiredoxin